MADTKNFTLSCPAPISAREQIVMAHGGGGKLMHQLLETYVIPAFRNDKLEARHDGAVFGVGPMRLAFTTDSYVVRPMFFPGGDIGTLAINGTVNDLAMCGARPLYLSAGLIMEEGLAVDDLARVLDSMKGSAESADIQVVTGDTKVVDKGKGDGLYINTSGVGVVEHTLNVSPASVRVGDAILVSGDVGRHGIAIMAVREGLAFETTIESDCASVAAPVLAMLDGGIEVHCLRDLTRGGLATTLVEIAESSRLHISIIEENIAVEETVRGACEILGFDPLYLANEGRFIAFVPQEQAERSLAILRGHEVSAKAMQIGSVKEGHFGTVSMRSTIGTERVLDMLTGEQLPRIC